MTRPICCMLLVGSLPWKDDRTGNRRGSGSGIEPIVTGEAEGTLYGGCLSMLAAFLGTPYAIKTDETILFIEDIGRSHFKWIAC